MILEDFSQVLNRHKALHSISGLLIYLVILLRSMGNEVIIGDGHVGRTLYLFTGFFYGFSCW